MRRIAVGAAIILAVISAVVVATRLAGGEGRRAEIAAPSSVDVGFAQDMAVHHQQAVVMAAYAQQHADSPDVRGLAGAIDSAQQREIGQMVGWLQSWGKPESTDRPPMSWMPSGMSGHMHGMGHHGSDVALMPGMATPAQLDRLVNLTGAQLDVQFLTLMTRHHEGGLPMAKYAASHARLPYVRAAASTMIQDQQREIDLMRTLLATRAGNG